MRTLVKPWHWLDQHPKSRGLCFVVGLAIIIFRWESFGPTSLMRILLWTYDVFAIYWYVGLGRVGWRRRRARKQHRARVKEYDELTNGVIRDRVDRRTLKIVREINTGVRETMTGEEFMELIRREPFEPSVILPEP